MRTGWLGFIAIATAVTVRPAMAQTVEYTSPAGVAYRSLADTGPVARAEAAVKAHPGNVDTIIALGLAQVGAQQYREAIATFTKALAIQPNNARVLSLRGHRYLSIREFAKAEADLSRGSRIDPSVYDNWYHLGIVRFAKGDFNGAAEAFTHSQAIPPNNEELKGSTDWLWMSLARAGKMAEANAMLARHPDSLPDESAYNRRVQLYRGQVSPDSLITAADTSGIQVATLNYGLGNWYLVRGDTATALARFRAAVQAKGGWPAFGFIISEIELTRLK